MWRCCCLLLFQFPKMLPTLLFIYIFLITCCLLYIIVSSINWLIIEVVKCNFKLLKVLIHLAPVHYIKKSGTEGPYLQYTSSFKHDSMHRFCAECDVDKLPYNVVSIFVSWNYLSVKNIHGD